MAVEADWPDAWRVNRYARADTADEGDGANGGIGADTGAAEALGGFVRVPS